VQALLILGGELQIVAVLIGIIVLLLNLPLAG